MEVATMAGYCGMRELDCLLLTTSDACGGMLRGFVVACRRRGCLLASSWKEDEGGREAYEWAARQTSMKLPRMMEGPTCDVWLV